MTSVAERGLLARVREGAIFLLRGYNEAQVQHANTILNTGITPQDRREYRQRMIETHYYLLSSSGIQAIGAGMHDTPFENNNVNAEAMKTAKQMVELVPDTKIDERIIEKSLRVMEKAYLLCTLPVVK